MTDMTQGLPSEANIGIRNTDSAGSMLASRRQAFGLSVADVADKLKLSKKQIEALESDAYAQLPGNTFVRGFVRNYARLLELDPQPLLHYLEQHLPKEIAQAALPKISDEAMPVLGLGASSSNSRFLIAILFGLALATSLMAAAWKFGFIGTEPSLTLVSLPESQPAVTIEPTPTYASPQATPLPLANQGGTGASEQTQAITTPSPTANPSVLIGSAPSAPQVVDSPKQAPNVSGNEIRIVAMQDSWVQITDANGQRLANEIIAAGQNKIIAGTPPYKVRIGNGTHTELWYQGKKFDLSPYIKTDVANLELQ